jgi:hypothetical protein
LRPKNRLAVAGSLQVILVDNAQAVSEQVALLEAPQRLLPLVRRDRSRDIEPEELLDALLRPREVLERDLLRITRHRRLRGMDAADLSAESVEACHCIAERIRNDLLPEFGIDGCPERDLLSDEGQVRLQDLPRVVGAAVGAKREHTVDRVAKGTVVADNLSLEVAFCVEPDLRRTTLDLHAHPDTEATAGPVIEFQGLQILQDRAGYLSERN